MQLETKRTRAVRFAARSFIESLEPRQLLAAGDPDPSFGGGDGFAGAAFTGLPNSNHDSSSSMAVQPDGKIVLAGYSGSGGNTDNRVAIARFNANGTLDNTFDGDGLVTFTLVSTDVAAVAIAPDGKIVVGGRTTFGTTQTWDWFLMRFNANGTPDTTFGGGDGWISRDFGNNFGEDIEGIAIQSDNKIVVTGIVPQATSQLVTARFEEDGDLDPTFSGDGFDVVDFFGGVDAASNLMIDPDGKIVVVGGSVPPGAGQYRRFVLLRYNANGILDNTFDGDGKATTDFGQSAFAKDILRDPAGNYIVGGLVGSNGNAMNYLVARYTPTGTLDTSFGGSNSIPGSSMIVGAGHVFGDYGIARQSDGKILFGGNSSIGEPFATYFGLARFTSNGIPDSTFNNGAVRNYDAPGYIEGFGDGSDVAISGDGKILLSGSAWANDTDFGVFKLITEGSVTPSSVFLTGTVLNVIGTSGNDVLTLSSTSTTFTAVLNGMTYQFTGPSSGGVLSINVDLKEGNDSETHTSGVPGGTVILGDGNDTLTVGTGNKTSPQLNVSGGNGDDAVVLAVAAFTPVNFDGGAGSDTYTYNGSQGNDDLVVSDTQILDEGFFGGSYSNVERVRILANFSTDTIHLRSSNSTTTFELNGGDGTDTFDISNSAAPNSFLGPITVIGGPGTDSLNIGLTGATGTDFTLLGVGRGRYTFTNRAPVDFQEVENDLTPFGPTVKSSAFNYQTSQAISVQFSEDTQDLDIADLTVKNLTTNTTIDPSRFFLNSTHGSGIATLAEWKVFSSFRLPDGKYEARLPAGSVRDVNGNLSGNEFVMNFYVLTGDLNGDHAVSIADFITLASNFGKIGATWADGDINYDQQVTIADFIDTAAHFGQSLSGEADPIPMAAAPEEIASSNEGGTLFEKTRHRAKAKHHRRTHSQRTLRASNLFLRA